MLKMNKLWKIYCAEFPEFIKEFAKVKEMQRLKDVGMNCGCEYTSFERFQNLRPYSRFDHSIGVALIIWNFTGDLKQTIAGLLHDIATPVFAHTVDFLNGDHEKQESTETATATLIESSEEILLLLDKYGVALSDIVDYHVYPIADNDSPKLSADRLEYTLGNMYNYGFASIAEIKSIYGNLKVGVVAGQEELLFKSIDQARLFCEYMIDCSNIYICDEDRFSMQALADLIALAIERKVMTRNDLYLDEKAIIKKFEADEVLFQAWSEYRSYSKIQISSKNQSDHYWIKVPAKKRYINPMVDQVGRIIDIDAKIKQRIQMIKNKDFSYWLSAA